MENRNEITIANFTEVNRNFKDLSIPIEFSPKNYDKRSGKYVTWSPYKTMSSFKDGFGTLHIFDPKTMKALRYSDAFPMFSGISESGYFVYEKQVDEVRGEKNGDAKTVICVGNIETDKEYEIAPFNFDKSSISWSLSSTSNHFPFGVFGDIFYFLDETTDLSGNKGQWVFFNMKNNEIVKKISKKRLNRIIPDTVNDNKILGIIKDGGSFQQLVFGSTVKEKLVWIDSDAEITETSIIDEDMLPFQVSNDDGWIRCVKKGDDKIDRRTKGLNKPEYLTNFKTGKFINGTTQLGDAILSIGGDYVVIAVERYSKFRIIAGDKESEELIVKPGEGVGMMSDIGYDPFSKFGYVISDKKIPNPNGDSDEITSVIITTFRFEGGKWETHEFKINELPKFVDDGVSHLSFTTDGRYAIASFGGHTKINKSYVLLQDGGQEILSKNIDGKVSFSENEINNMFFIGNELAFLKAESYMAGLDVDYVISKLNVDNFLEKVIFLGENAVKTSNGSKFFGENLKNKLIKTPDWDTLHNFGKKINEVSESIVEIDGKKFNKKIVFRSGI